MQTLSQKLYAHLVTTFSREDGQTMAEYGVVLAVITATVIGAITLLSGNVNTALRDVAGRLIPGSTP